MSWLATIVASLLNLIGSWGYLGIFILMAIESSFIPIPSEAVMIPAGALAALGQMNIVLAFIAGVLGNIVGAIICYYIAFVVGRKGIESLNVKYGKYFLISKNAVQKTDAYFERHGHITVLLARLIPGIRHLISLPAGFARMNKGHFIAYTAMGSAIWNIVLLSLGYFLGKNSAFIAKDLQSITYIVIILAVIVICAYWWHTFQKNKRRSTKDRQIRSTDKR